MVILTMVRANTRASVGFLVDDRRLNVSLTRAKQACVCFGHCRTLATQATPIHTSIHTSIHLPLR